MKYAIHILEQEKELLSKVINLCNWKDYSEALKDRKGKLKSIEQSIEKLKSCQRITN